MRNSSEKRMETEKRRPLGVYVHIPFCVKKCDYCDFLSFPSDETTRERYVEALCTEIRANRENGAEYEVCTVYFGGGTPSVLTTEQLGRILQTIRDTFSVKGLEAPAKAEPKKKGFSLFGRKKEEPEPPKYEETPGERLTKVLAGELAEITIEVNPGTVTAEDFKGLYELGFNRISMGLQSADEKELSNLGRIHTAKEFEDAFLAARAAGFLNISGDLMSGLPGQTADTLTKSIRFLTGLSPEHISVYSLQLEENTKFMERYGENGPEHAALLSEEEDRALYELTGKLLEEAGYERYEISNYAKKGFESRHNSSYWTGTEYLGCGLGASSLMSNARFHNTGDMEAYLTNAADPGLIREDIDRLVEKERMEEFMFLGLRLCRGIRKEEFRQRFGREIETVYGAVLKKLTAQKLIAECDGRIFLTNRGIDVSNVVLAEFLLDEFVRR